MHICEALRKDQTELRELITQLMELEDEDIERRNELVQQLGDLLVPHARAEEAVLYNSLRMIEAAKDLAMECYRHHMEVEGLLRMLQVQDMANFNWRETADRLQSALVDHISNEESAVFSATESLFTDEEAEAMAEVFEEIKGTTSEKGFIGTTLDMMTNLMPPRFTDTIRDTWTHAGF